MADYVIRIVVEGEDRASGPLQSAGGAMGNIAQIAAGGLLAGGVAAFGNALGEAARQGLEAVSSYERLGMSLEALLAREIKNASGVEKTITVGQQRIQLTQKEIEQLGSLKAKLNEEELARTTLAAKIQEQKERIRQLTLQYGENGLVVIKERAELAQMENAYSKSGATIETYGNKIAALESKQGKLVSVTQKVVEGQLSMNEALAQAGPQAEALISWVEKLAVLSPFSSQDIATSLQQAMNFQFTSEQAKRLVQDLVDMAAATGKTSDNMRLVSYAVGQINLSDKLLMQDLRQLINAGVDVEGVLKKMGFSLSDVGVKAIDSKKFIAELMKTIESDFGGAAERQATTLNGLLSSLEDIKAIGLRELFTGTFTALKPLLSDIVNLATSADFRAGLRNIGTSIGDGVRMGIDWIKQGIGWIQQFVGMLQARNVGPTIFSTLLTAAALLTTFFTTNILPSIQRFVAFALPLLQSAFVQIASFVQLVLMPALGLLGGWIQTVFIPALGQMANWIGANILPLLGQLAVFVVTVLLPAFLQFAGFFIASVIPALVEFATWLGTLLMPVLQTLWSLFVTYIVPALQEFGTWLQVNLPIAIQNLSNWFNNVFLPAMRNVGAYITTTLLPTIGNLAAQVAGALASAFGTAKRLLDAIWKLLTNVATVIQTQVVKAWTDLQTIIDTISPPLQTFIDDILKVMRDVLNAIKSAVEWLIEHLAELAAGLAAIQLPDFMQRHSPSPLELTLMNSNAYLREMQGLLPNSLGALAGLRNPIASEWGARIGDAPRVRHEMGGQSGRAVQIETLVISKPHDFDSFLREFERRTGVEFAVGT